MPKGESDRRPKRVAELLRSHLGLLFIREIQPLVSSLVTVTRVKISPDLLTARVFLTVLGPDDPSRVLELLREKTPHLRHSIATSINLKYNPTLVFELDPEPEWQTKLEDLIRNKTPHEPKSD